MKHAHGQFARRLMVAGMLLSLTLCAAEVLEVANINLAFAFENNSVRADAMYKGKRILVHGPVTKVQRGPVLVLPGVGRFGNILCYMKGSEKSKVAALAIPAEVGIEGVCKGSLGRQVVIEGCVLRETWGKKEERLKQLAAEQAKRQEEAKRAAARAAALRSVAATTGGNTVDLAADLEDEEEADPETELKSLLASSPNDREAHAALGHLYFQQAKQDGRLLASAIEHLSRAAGDDLDRKADIIGWLGKARFELAYIHYRKKEYDRALPLVEAIFDRRSSRRMRSHPDEPAPTYHLLRAKLLQRSVGQLPENKQASRKREAVGAYARYFAPKIGSGKGLSDKECRNFVRMFDYAFRNRLNPDLDMLALGDTTNAIIACGDRKTIRAILGLMEKHKTYHSTQSLLKKHLNAMR